MSLTPEISITDSAQEHSLDETEKEGLFNATSFRAFKPQLESWEIRIIRCLFADDLESFTKSCVEMAMFIEKDILVDDLQVSSWREMAET